VPRTPRPVFRSRCTGRRTTCKAPLCRRRSTVSTLMLKYSAAASRSSNRGPEPTRRDEDGRRDADKILGAGDAATGSVLRARALSGRHWPAVSGPPSVPTSSLIGFTVMSSSRRCSSSLAFRLCGSVSCHLIFAEADLIPLPRLPDTATLVVSGRSGFAYDSGGVSAVSRSWRRPATPARPGDSSGDSSRPPQFFRPCEESFTGDGEYHLLLDPR
jgi:hypothetical protein